MNQNLKIWMMEYEIWFISIPIIVLIIAVYVAFKLDVETNEVGAVVGKTFLEGSDYGEVQKVMVHLNNGTVAYISNKIRAPISEGEEVCLYQRKKLIGKLSYKLKAIGSCVSN